MPRDVLEDLGVLERSTFGGDGHWLHRGKTSWSGPLGPGCDRACAGGRDDIELKPSGFQVFIQGSGASSRRLARDALEQRRAAPARRAARAAARSAGAVARMKRSSAATTAAASSRRGGRSDQLELRAAVGHQPIVTQRSGLPTAQTVRNTGTLRARGAADPSRVRPRPRLRAPARGDPQRAATSPGERLPAQRALAADLRGQHGVRARGARSGSSSCASSRSATATPTRVLDWRRSGGLEALVLRGSVDRRRRRGDLFEARRLLLVEAARLAADAALATSRRRRSRELAEAVAAAPATTAPRCSPTGPSWRRSWRPPATSSSS